MVTGSVISTERRVVAAPWERRGLGARSVHLEDHVEPDPVAVALYQQEFPDRFVAWDPRVQLFGIYQRPEDANRAPTLIEWVFHWDIACEDGEEFSDEEVAQLVERRDPRMRRMFMAFDEPFVKRRLLERARFLDLGPRKYQQRIRDRNAARKAAITRHHGGNMAAAMGEMRRWIPVLAEYEETGRINPGMRTPYHRVGIDLKSPKEKTA